MLSERNVLSKRFRLFTHFTYWHFEIEFRSMDLLRRQHVIVIDEAEMKAMCVMSVSVSMSVSSRRRRLNSFRWKIIIYWDFHP